MAGLTLKKIYKLNIIYYEKISLALLLILTTINLYSQETLVCGTSESQTYVSLSNNTTNLTNTTATIDSQTPIVFNIFFNLVKNDAGVFTSPTFTVSENSIQNAVRYLNVTYNPYNIFFKYLGTREIPSSQFTNLSYNNSLALHNQYANPEALNLFFLNSFTGWGTVPTAYVLPNCTSMFFKYPAVSNEVNQEQPAIIHEMAHILNLRHVFEYNTTLNCERVTRDPNNPLYNANTHGDEVEDTPAQPQQPCCPPANDCVAPFNTTQTNFYNEQFENIIYGNFMSYSVNCNKHFSSGQIARVRQSIFSNWDYYSPAMNTVESLYQPYERIPVITSVFSITNNNDGTANVCRNYTQKFKFQKGFTYNFPDNQLPDLTVYNNNNLPLISFPPFNCPVTILQLAPGQTNLVTNSGQTFTICRGTICQDEEYVKGMIYSTQILGSMNITVEELNKIEVNDPALYNNLMEQYYYILKKETASGAIKEEVFYKPQ